MTSLLSDFSVASEIKIHNSENGPTTAAYIVKYNRLRSVSKKHYVKFTNILYQVIENRRQGVPQ